MIEKTVLDYLALKLDKPVYMEMPSTVPEEFFLIEKTGSSRLNRVDTATFALQSISSNSLYRAAVMNDELKTAMDDITATTIVSKSALNGDYNFTDEETKLYRYQAVYDLTYVL